MLPVKLFATTCTCIPKQLILSCNLWQKHVPFTITGQLHVTVNQSLQFWRAADVVGS